MSKLAMLATTFATLASSAAAAQPNAEAPNASAGLHADAEVDPTAYVLDGFSLHVGVGYRRLRVDLGAYAMKLPQALHGHDELDVSFTGYGIKLQYFLFGEQTGGFVGLDGGVARLTVAKPDMRLAERDTQVGVGVNFGWRFAITDALYATAWLGLGANASTRTVMFGDTTYEPSKLTVFPAVHLGYRFR